MGTSNVLIPISFTAVAFVVMVVWYLRYRQNKLVVERVRRSTNSRGVRRIYQIHVAQNPVYVQTTPPPTFSEAVKYPLPPQYFEIEVPPPTYQEYLIISAKDLYRAQQLTTLSSVAQNMN